MKIFGVLVTGRGGKGSSDLEGEGGFALGGGMGQGDPGWG